MAVLCLVPKTFPSLTKTQLGPITASAGTVAYCTDEVHAEGTGCIVYGDGTNWRRGVDGGILGSYIYRYISGQDILSAQLAVAATTIASLAATLKAYRFDLLETVTLTQAIAEVIGLNASGLNRFALYNGTAITPTTLITGTDQEISTTVVGDKTMVFSSPVTLRRGPIWIVQNGNSTTQIFRGLTQGSCPSLTPATGTAGVRNIITVAQTYGAMPANWPSGGNYSAASVALLRFRVS